MDIFTLWTRASGMLGYIHTLDTSIGYKGTFKSWTSNYLGPQSHLGYELGRVHTFNGIIVCMDICGTQAEGILGHIHTLDTSKRSAGTFTPWTWSRDIGTFSHLGHGCRVYCDIFTPWTKSLSIFVYIHTLDTSIGYIWTYSNLVYDFCILGHIQNLDMIERYCDIFKPLTRSSGMLGHSQNLDIIVEYWGIFKPWT